MSKRQHDQDDWSADSASLFRDVRRTLDAKALERAPVEAVFARIQAAGHEASSAAPRAARAWLGQAAKGVLAVVLLGAASFGALQAIREPSAATHRDEPAAGAVAAAAGSVVEQPGPTPSLEPTDFQPNKPPVARRQEQSRAAVSPRRRSPSNEGSQRASASGKSSVVETLAAPSQDTTPTDSAEKPAAVTRVAAKPDPARAREAARKTGPPAQDEPSELALVKRIHTELREAKFSTVLSLCAEHERLWPHGMFELEREGARAIALCGARSADAAREASQFLAAHPQVPVAMRVKTACAMLLPKQ